MNLQLQMPQNLIIAAIRYSIVNCGKRQRKEAEQHLLLVRGHGKTFHVLRYLARKE